MESRFACDKPQHTQGDKHTSHFVCVHSQRTEIVFVSLPTPSGLPSTNTTSTTISAFYAIVTAAVGCSNGFQYRHSVEGSARMKIRIVWKYLHGSVYSVVVVRRWFFLSGFVLIALVSIHSAIARTFSGCHCVTLAHLTQFDQSTIDHCLFVTR